MALETELKLRLPPGAAARLLQHPLLAGSTPERQRLLNTYYDTPDLELLGRRMALRHRRKGWDWLLTVKTANPASGGLARRNEWEAPVAPGHFDFAHVDDADLRHWLEKRIPRLQAAFTTDFTRLAWIVEPTPGTRVEIALDRGTIQSQGKKEALAELELELLSGPESALFALAMELATALGPKQALHPVAASKAERGYALFTGRTSPPVKARPTCLIHGEPPHLPHWEVFRDAALNCLQHLQANEAGAQAGKHPEYLHQARIAIRRLRSLFKLFAPALPPAFLAAWAPPWRQLGQILGETRNWDVFLHDTLPPLVAAFPQAIEPARLARQAEGRRKAAQQLAQRTLASAAYSRLILEFTAALFALEGAPGPETEALPDFASRRLSRRAQQARRLAKTLATLDDAGRHQLRLAFKKLRYAIEFLAPPTGSRRAQRYQQALAQLQETLGYINDLATAGELITVMLPARPGLVHGWLAGRGDLLQAVLAPQLHEFLALPPPWESPRRNKVVKRHR